MGKWFDFVKGAVVGGVIGSAVAMFMAPESGMVLQERLRSRFRQVLDDARQAAAARRRELEAELKAAQQQGRHRNTPGDGYS